MGGRTRRWEWLSVEPDERQREIDRAIEAWAVGSELVLLVDAAHDAGLGPLECRYMATESMLVHLRCCIEFLIGRKSTRATDLTARRFDPGWTAAPAAAVTALEALLPVLDRHLAHLTIDRLRDVAHWPIVEPVDAVLEVMVMLDTAMAEADAPMRRHFAPYVGLALQRWALHRPRLQGVDAPATTFTSRPFLVPLDDDVGIGGWVARLGPFTSAGLAPLWPPTEGDA
ncbi:MAG: hypothetical protein QOJ67_2522 [Acidimicrobiaceae bacterium]|jgi:hypothetical protein